MRSSAADRAVDAGVAADGSGLIVVQRARGARRSVRAVAFGPSGRLGRPQALSAPGARADFAASAVAPSGAAVVVWFRHRGAPLAPGGRDARARRARASAPPQALSAFVRRPCCTSVSVSIGARGDAAATWTSTARPAVWAALRGAGPALRRARGSSPATRATHPGSSSATAAPSRSPTAPSTCRCARPTGCSCAGRRAAGAFGPAEHVNPGGGVTIAGAAVTPAGACCSPGATRSTARACTSPRPRRASR